MGSEKLTELLERVKAATGPSRELDCWLFGKVGDSLSPWSDRDCAYAATSPETTCHAPRYTASIDAALALVERKLPGWGWARSVFERVSLLKRMPNGDWHFEVRDVTGATTPLAILAALLTALAATGTGK